MKKRNHSFNGCSIVPLKTKQIYLIVAMTIVSILLLILISEIRPYLESNIKASELLENKIFVKIISGVIHILSWCFSC